MTRPTNEPMSREEAISRLDALKNLCLCLNERSGRDTLAGDSEALSMAIEAMQREGDLLESLAKIKHVINDECESWCFYCGESNPNYGPVVHKEDCLWLGVISQHAPQQPPPGARGQ